MHTGFTQMIDIVARGSLKDSAWHISKLEPVV